MNEKEFYYDLSVKHFQIINDTNKAIEDKNNRIMTSTLTIVVGLGYFMMDRIIKPIILWSYVGSIIFFMGVLLVNLILSQ